MSAQRLQILDDVVPATCRGTRIAIGSRDSTLLQQPHQLTHGVCDGDFGFALDQNVQLGEIVGAGLFATCVEIALGSDRRATGFEDLGDVRAVGDGPTSFLCTDKKMGLAVVQ